MTNSELKRHLKSYRNYTRAKKWRFVLHAGVLIYGTLAAIISTIFDLIGDKITIGLNIEFLKSFGRDLITFWLAGIVFGLIIWYTLPESRTRKENNRKKTDGTL